MQVNSIQTTYREISDIYDTTEDLGLSGDCINEMPVHLFETTKVASEVCCSICLQVRKNTYLKPKLSFDFGKSKNPECNCFGVSGLQGWRIDTKASKMPALISHGMCG